MELVKIIERVIQEQQSYRRIPVDIRIANGNIVLRAFRIYELNKEKKIIKGLTVLEEYIHAREGRDPQFCILKIEEIKELRCWNLNIEYNQTTG